MARQRKKTPQIVMVTWDDAVAGTGWSTHDKAEKPQECTSIGLIVADNKMCLILAGTWGMNGDQMESNNRMTIPKGWIKSRIPIKIIEVS